METKTFEIYWQTGNYSYKRILGIGKTIDRHNLWYWTSLEFNIPGLFSFHLNYNPVYYS